jgi:uncharacterized protein (TIGR00255 family)
LILSMTGFGRAEGASDAFLVTVEARSVNHRHLDVALRLPRALAALEAQLRKLVASRLDRGRVDVSVQLAPHPERAAPRVVVDPVLARDYTAQARALGRELGLTADVSLAWLLDRPGVLTVVEELEPPEPTALWPVLEDAASRAIALLIIQRATEGTALGAELRALLADFEQEVERAAAHAPAAAARREERLRERLRALVSDLGIDESRILIEAAAWAEKTDVTEELTRLRAHLTQVRAMLEKGGPVGRQLDFVIQELGREINTLGSKADDLDVSQAVIAAKGLLEKMREQIQNLE